MYFGDMVAIPAAVILLGLISGGASLASHEVLFGWKEMDFNFPSELIREQYLKSGQYVPRNNVPAGIKVYGNRVFITLPRWARGVPSTLNVINLSDAGGASASPKLEPFLSWEMQKVGDCSAFQMVQSMEIDEYGRMWIIDTGRVNMWAKAPDTVDNFCPAKLVIIDLETGVELRRHIFPANVVSPTSNYLNDIVVDCQGDSSSCFGYISDCNDNRMVVYNLRRDLSWFIQHSSMAGGSASSITNGAGINGIALSPKDQNHNRIYYTAISSPATYSIPTYLARWAVNGANLLDSDVTSHLNRTAQTGGIAMDSKGIFYVGQLRNYSVAYLDSNTPLGFAQETILISNQTDLQWPDTFTFGNDGYLYMMTNRLDDVQTGELDWNDTSFRVVRVFTGSKGYMHSAYDGFPLQQNLYYGGRFRR